VDLPPMPEMSGPQMDRMAQLHEDLGGAQGWADLGFHSADDMRRHFAHFDSIDDAIEDLEIRFQEQAELRSTGPGAGDEGAGTRPSTADAEGAVDEGLSDRSEDWVGAATPDYDAPFGDRFRDPWTGSVEDSAMLGANLGPPPGQGYHAHHIIPANEGGEGFDWLRTKLADHGIDINDADNGVWLAGGRGRNVEGGIPHTTYLHAGNRNDYLYTLTERLGDLEGPAFVKELASIQRELATGDFQFRSAPDDWVPAAVEEVTVP
jgi:hypothetical protein